MKATLDKHGEEKILEKVPLKRLTNDADMAGTAIYLASRAVTCVVLPVDGGRLRCSDERRFSRVGGRGDTPVRLPPPGRHE